MSKSEAKQEPKEAPSDAPPSPSSVKSEASAGGGDNRFSSISKSIQKNIETINFVTKEIEKINDRILFHSASITSTEESTLMNKVSQLQKDTGMKARDTSRMVKNLRAEMAYLAKASGSAGKSESETSEEEATGEKVNLEELENICQNVSKSFTNELLLYQSAIQDFKNELKERLTKRIQSIRPKSSEDFIDISLRSESSRYALFREIMAADESDLTEEQAKALKDEIAEKYVAIAELSSGASEMNKIFLNLASSATDEKGGGKLSDSDSSEERAKRTTSRSKKDRRSSTDRIVDELLGDPGGLDLSQRDKDSMDTSGHTTNTGKSSQRGMRNNRLLNFMKRHRTAKPAAAKSMRYDRSDIPPRKRRGRRARWMALFLLATVAVAALVGVVMIH